MEKTKKQKTILITAAALIIFFLGFLASNLENPYQTKESCSKEINETVITTANYINNYIITTLLTEAVKCEQVPINYQNKTYYLFLTECLNQGSGVE